MTNNLMKIFAIHIMTCLTFLSFGQNGRLKGKIEKSDSATDFSYLTVVLRLNGKETPVAVPNDNGKFEAGNIETGTYELIIRQIWSRDNVNVGVMVKNDSTTEVNLVYPPPCLFTRDTHPKCKGGHTDNIVPIVYGLTT